MGKQKMSKAQASIEIITIISLLIIASSVTIYTFYPQWDTEQRVNTAQTSVIDIGRVVDNIYSAGPGSKETITIRIPEGVKATQLDDYQVGIKLELSEGQTTDIYEIVKAAHVRGYIPTEAGTHQITVEYTDSGIISIGSSLSLTPSYTEVQTTPQNTTNITITAENTGKISLTNIQLSIEEGEREWVGLNETEISLAPGEDKKLLLSIQTPNQILPLTYTNYIRAETTEVYAEATINLLVDGEACGDTTVQGLEQCDTQTPFQFPDENNPGCPNTEYVECDAPNHRYKTRDAYGSCLMDCTCQEDTAEYVLCGQDCTSSTYCLNCAHCYDGVENCNEDDIDSGTVCEGYMCTPGNTITCGTTGCEGVRTCVQIGPTDYGWSNCSTYGQKCSDNKCCTCAASQTNPQKTLNTSTSISQIDCTTTITTCADTTTCTGGTFGYECTAMDTCSIDLDGSTVPITSDPSKCNGQTCRTTAYACTDQGYPCSGLKTTYLCQSGSCNAQTPTADNTGCSGITSCNVPGEIILHKLDKGWNEYMDPPSAYYGWWGSYHEWPETCENHMAVHTFTSGFNNAKIGAYYPYRSGKLKFYMTAYTVDWQHHDTRNACGWGGCGCRVRIGTNENNWKEWSFGCPSVTGYTKITVDMSQNPRGYNGIVNWNNIGYLQFKMGAALAGCSHCSDCSGAADYVTLSLT